MENKRRNPEELSTTKIIGRILEVIGVFILIVNAVLMNMEDKDLATIGRLLVVGVSMFFLGVILSHLPQERPQGKIPTIIYCSFCGVKNEEDAIYCKKCGKQISK